ncbi:MAG: signal peptidase I [Eubacterium sp.]|nr:signal peptidase I [Eubacterium sp.]
MTGSTAEAAGEASDGVRAAAEAAAAGATAAGAEATKTAAEEAAGEAATTADAAATGTAATAGATDAGAEATAPGADGADGKEEEKSGAAVLAEAAEAAEEEGEEDGKKKRKKKKKKDEKPKDVNLVKELLSLIIYIGIVVLICFLIITFVGRRTTVHGSSMEPTLQSGDSLWINMLAYRFGDPERYDIIVFPYEDEVHYIKRIIGLPGETVQISETGDISINGELLKEPIKFDRIRDNGIAANPITLGPDEYFVLGDNRNNSRDSRWADVGNIKRDKIVGKAVFRLTPLKKFGGID